MEESEQPKPITVELKDKEGNSKIVEFSDKLINFGGIFKTLDATEYSFKEFANEPHLLEKVKEFFEKHKYEKTSIQIKRPMVSNIFKDNVDAITYEVLKDYAEEAHEEEAVRLIALAEYLCIPEFKSAIYSAVASKFYIGSTEEDLEKFRELHNLHELSVDEEEAIIKEYPGTFAKLQERFQAELRKLEA